MKDTVAPSYREGKAKSPLPLPNPLMHTYELHLGPEHGSLGVQVAFIDRIINISAARVGSYARVICDSIELWG